MANHIRSHTLFMIEIACSVLSGPCVNTGSVRKMWAFPGTVRATFTLPFTIDIVEVYRTGTEVLLKSGEILVGMSQPYDHRRETPNAVCAFYICAPESLQAHALAAVIRQDIRSFANPLRRRVVEFLRE